MKTAPEGMSVVEELGVGSVFEVAIVRDALGHEFVLKRPRGPGGSAARDALFREAQVLRAARTPHLPALLSAGSDAEGPYLVEGRARGEPLRHRLPAGGRPPIDAASWLAIALSTSGALSQLHAVLDPVGPLEIVHGDLSPDNIFYAEAPRHTTLIDLSSATWRAGTVPVFPADRGTLPYAPPELARGEVLVGQERDTYALAAVLLSLAVGPICEATTAASRVLEIGSRGVLRERIDARPELPGRARAALKAALAFDPECRLRSSAELAHEFLSESAGVG